MVGMVAVVATIAVVSLSSARNRGRDTGIKSNLSLIRQRAESAHLEDGHYNRVCGVNGYEQDKNIAALIKAAETESPDGLSGAICSGDAVGDTSNWAISVSLTTTGYWCVDSSGFSGYTAGGLNHSNDTVCQ